MKKLLIVLGVALMLCACGTEKTLVSNPDEVIISAEKNSFTKQDLFESMKQQDYSQFIINSLMDKIVKFEGITDEHINERVNNAFEGIKAVYGDQFPIVASYYGGEEVLKANLTAEAKSQELAAKYFDLNKDQYIEEYKPVLAYAFFVEDAQKASSIKTEVEAGVDIKDAAVNAGYTEGVFQAVYTDKSDIALDVKEYFANTTETGKIEIIPTTVTTSSANGSIDTDRYYVVQIIDKDVNNFIDDFYATLATYIDQTVILSHFFDKYNLEVFDQDTYELLVKKYPGVK